MFSLVTGKGRMPMAASIDIAANCNLRCQHCYLYEKDHQQEGIDTDAAFMAAVRQFRRDYPTILHCTWVGGEPMWRKELLRKCI
jgi:Fe-coproporphyrin III synthase